jgi:hypothetical protein
MPADTANKPGGQVVAGSNPVSTTKVRGGFGLLEIRFWDCLTQTIDPNQLSATAEIRLLIAIAVGRLGVFADRSPRRRVEAARSEPC